MAETSAAPAATSTAPGLSAMGRARCARSRLPLALLLAAGAVVLLLCCANIAALMLVRARHEAVAARPASVAAV